jgi:dihydrofolate reductase
MGKLTVIAFATLDNVVEDPQLWSLAYQSQEPDSPVNQVNFGTLQEADAMLLGRVTYEGFASAWPDRSGDPYSDRFNAMRKYVVSNTLSSADWNNTEIVAGDDQLEQVRALREQQDLLVWGSPTLVDALTEAGLVDEYVLLVAPIVRGEGRRIFGGVGGQVDLRVVDAVQDPAGMLALRLAPAA